MTHEFLEGSRGEGVKGRRSKGSRGERVKARGVHG